MININNNKIFTIAETAMHHEGDFQFQTELINNIINYSEVDYIKMHITLDIDEYLHKDHAGYEVTKKWLFGTENWKILIERVKNSSKKNLFLLNDKKAIEFGMAYQPEIVEIHSVCLNDIKLLKALHDHLNENIKVILGVGGSSLSEIESAVNLLKHNNIVLMFGFQNYPTKFENINLRKIKKIMQLYPDFDFGYADHTAWNHPDNVLITLFGAALGMNYLEKHVTHVFGEERTDSSAAISVNMLNDLIEKLNLLMKCNGNGLLELTNAEKAYSIFGPMKKAAILNNDVQMGEEIRLKDLDFKRTSQISDLSQLEVLDSIGKKYSCNIKKGKCLNKHMIISD